MSGLPKKRKRENASKPSQSRSIDSFFGKAREPADRKPTSAGPEAEGLTDEELARKLHAEWNGEEDINRDKAGLAGNGHPQPARSSTPSQKSSSALNHSLSPAPTSTPPPTSCSPIKRGGVLSLQTSASAEDTISSTLPFDQPPATFDPRPHIERLKGHWQSEGGNASYSLLTRAFTLVNNTQSRIKIVDILVNTLRILIEGDPQSLLPAVWLSTNAFAPPYVPLELGLGGSAISKALKKAYGLDSQGLKTLYDRHGDAGDVAFEAKKKQSYTLRRPKALSIQGVFDSLMKIANSKGAGSQETKQRIVEKLLQDARGAEESRYIVRTLVQHLRIGAVKTTMLIALARAFLHSKPPSAGFDVRPNAEFLNLKKEELSGVYAKAEEIVKACYARHPNYNDLVPCLLECGVSEENLARCGLTLHIPLLPMLGSITRDLTQMLTKLNGRQFTCEYKYDGQRAQVHCDHTGKTSIFSRHLELMTDKYPDLVSIIPQIRGQTVSSFILEGEIVAVDQETGDLLPFQTLANRAKKNVEIGNIKVNVCLFAFDLMYLNGQSLLDRYLRERREHLKSLFTEISNRFTWVRSIDATSSDTEPIFTFFNDALASKCEGIMVKVLDDNNPEDQARFSEEEPPALDSTPFDEDLQAPVNPTRNNKTGGRRRRLLSTYEPDKRLESWLKVKKDYNAASDTLDLIPIAGWHGQGRKSKWWSPILLAVRNPETGSLEAVTKCMSGFTDKFYQANKDKYSEHSENVISRPSYVEYGSEPEVWFEPQEVWEVAFADITLSPTYTAAIGLVSEARGLSLRFPRFLKIREDKSIDEASTSGYLAQLWEKQLKRSQVAEEQTAD